MKNGAFRLSHGGRLVKAVLRGRLNRFVVEVRLEESGAGEIAHLANTGRLSEILRPGRPALLMPAARPGRRTRFDLALVRQAGVWIHVDSRLANRFAAAAIEAGALAPFRDHRIVRPEPPLDGGRLDFLLEGPAGRAWMEVKSVNLVRDGVAMFPDAPTERGRRHLEALERLSRRGVETHAVFLVQRADSRLFRPNTAMDPAFAAALRGAARAGTRVHAWGLRVDSRYTRLLDPLPLQI